MNQNSGVHEVDTATREQARKKATTRRKPWHQRHSPHSVPENQTSGQFCSSPSGSWRLRSRSRPLGGRRSHRLADRLQWRVPVHPCLPVQGIGSIVWKLLVAVLYLIVGLYFLLKPSPHGVQPGLGFFAGATPGTPLCRRPVAGLLLEDRDGTGGGGYSRVSSGLQAPVTYHHRSFNSGNPPLQNKVGHLTSSGGKLLARAEV
jgi:hypothetical protein